METTGQHAARGGGPVTPRGAGSPSAGADPAGLSAGGDAGGKGARILVVDDEKRILQSFTLMLGEYGFTLRTAQSAEQALALVSAERFDIAFLDHYIGRDRGLVLLQQLASQDPELSFVMITANGSTELAVEALKLGASDFITKPFFAEDIVKCIDFVNRKRDLDRQKRELLATLETKVRERTRELETVYLDVLTSLAQALETRDFSTYGHCKRVSHYCGMISDALDMSADDRHYLEAGAMLHDVGKIGISDSILFKPASLDDGEWQSLRHHPAKGVDILKPIRYLEPALPGILYHHENYDGSGYPEGRKGADIPLIARIIAVADAWDVMRSDRPYRKALTRDEARRELIKFAGIQFDPAIVDILLRRV